MIAGVSPSGGGSVGSDAFGERQRLANQPLRRRLALFSIVNWPCFRLTETSQPCLYHIRVFITVQGERVMAASPVVVVR